MISGLKGTEAIKVLKGTEVFHTERLLTRR